MSLLETLLKRSHSKCELCSDQSSLTVYEIPPAKTIDESTAILVCQTCKQQIENPESIDMNHWRCLSESMWSEFPAVQVMAYRMLNRLQNEDWARTLFNQLYLDDSLLEFASSGYFQKVEQEDTGEPTLDSNGTRLKDGDSVTLIKDLDVKGAGFTAKRGTLVKDISLTNNPKHIEGKVNGIQIVLVAAYLKKA